MLGESFCRSFGPSSQAVGSACGSFQKVLDYVDGCSSQTSGGKEGFSMGILPNICLFLFCFSGHSCEDASTGVGELADRLGDVGPCGCGGEGSWHRDLMHKDKQKSHCQGFPPFHSSAGDHLIFPPWDVFVSPPFAVVFFNSTLS